MIRLHAVPVFLVSLLLAESNATAQGALSNDTLVEYIRGRDDLTKKERKVWEREIRKSFGGAALNRESDQRVEITVAKSIISAAIFMRVKPKKAVKAAWEGWRGALGYVPPPIAIHYQILALEGRKPRGRPIDLAFKFPDYYNEEIAPDLVAYWEEGLKKGTIQDAALAETKEALEATRIKMRPLLLDKLRLLARLDRRLQIARGSEKAEIQRDMKEVEAELLRSFSRVARRPAVIDRRKRPFDRLRVQLDDLGLKLTAEDRLLDPNAGRPPPRPVPKIEPPAPPSKPKNQDDPPLVEPERPPLPPLPDQPRAGDPTPPKDPLKGRSLGDLLSAYLSRLKRVIEPWIGTPYRWGNATKRVGTDCSGFTKGVYREGFAVDLPRVSRDQYRMGRSVPKSSLRAGDLVFFDTKDVGRVNHVGIYAGRGKFAHASSSRGVVYDRLGSRYFKRAYRGARRVLAYPD